MNLSPVRVFSCKHPLNPGFVSSANLLFFWSPFSRTFNNSDYFPHSYWSDFNVTLT